ncbi:MAG: hypothetical protein ABI876_15500 [Bacteroidota bacterium]
MQQHRIYLIGGDDDESVTFTEEIINDTCRLTCVYRGKKIYADAPDFFEALCHIRWTLEQERLFLFCYGGSMNVYPSELTRSRLQGKKAYRMTMGKEVGMEDLVDIFAEGPDVIPASVAMQLQYLKDWMAGEKKPG